MATTMSTVRKDTSGARARLEDLDVREVSVVDRPANRRRFLIVKRATSELAANQEGDEMAVAASAVHVGKGAKGGEESLLDLLGLSLIDEDEDEGTEAEGDDEGVPEVTLKAADRGQLCKALEAAVQKLSAASTRLDGDDKEAAVKGATADVKAVAAQLSKLADSLGGGKPEGGGDKGEANAGDAEGTEKADSGKLKAGINKATGKLMKLVQSLKAEKADMPSDVPDTLREIADMLDAAMEAAGGGGGEEETEAAKAKKTTKAVEPLEVFVQHGDGTDPAIIFKRGAKMKKARLNAFKKAVETLQGLLQELERGDAVDNAGDKGATTKAATPDLTAALVKGFEALEAKVNTAIAEAIKPLGEKLDGVKKKVDGIDGAAAGAGDGDGDEVTKRDSSKNFWGSVFR